MKYLKFQFKFQLSQSLSENSKETDSQILPQHTHSPLPFPAFSLLMTFKRKENLLSQNFSLMLEMLKILTASSCEISHQIHSAKRLWIRKYRPHYSLKLTLRLYYVEYSFLLLMLHFCCIYCARCMSLLLQRDL